MSWAIFLKNEHPKGFGEWKIPQLLTIPSALAVALATGRVRWRAAILHNELIVSRPSVFAGLNYNGSLCKDSFGSGLALGFSSCF